MLSTSVIKNVSEASHYYAASDNYYTIEEGIEKSEWFGKGAAKLNLDGAIDAVEFTKLLKGEMPNGEIIGKKIDNKVIHRPGWDLTFSAPKSVSIMALVAGDKRLIDAHRKSVHVALSEIERGCSETRIKNKDNVTFHFTKNITAGLFHHDLSRAEDPQLHTHSVVMNLTERLDGKWRSMASKLGRYDKDTQGDIHGFIERVRNNKRYFGKLYEAELAYQVQQLGYEIVTDEKTGVFQIKGIANEVIEYFSKRRNKIEKHLNDTGLSGQKAAEVATLHTRENKIHSDRETLLEKWMEDSKKLGFDGAILMKEAQLNLGKEKSNNAINPNNQALNILHESIDYIRQFKTTFKLEELLEEASSIAIHKNCNVKELIQAADHLIEKGNLLSLENDAGRSYLMSQKTVEDENTIKRILNQKNTIPIDKEKFITKHLKKYKENSIEYNALSSVYSEDKYVLIEGKYSKEFISSNIIEIAKKEKINLAIVSPNLITSKQFALDLKANTFWEKVKSLFSDNVIQNYSTAQFLKQEHVKSPDILLIQNAHLLSAKEQAQLLEWGQDRNTKMLFFAEKNLLLSQKKGVDVNYLAEHGIKTITLNEKENTLKFDVSKSDLSNIFNKISSKIVEVDHKDDRLFAMASEFSHKKNHTGVYLVTNNRKDVEQLNLLTHDQLKSEEKLEKFISVDVLKPSFIPEHRATIASSYTKGEFIRFTNQIGRNFKSEYLEIISIDKKQNEVLLKNENNKLIAWKPEKNAEVFKLVKQEWGVGERIQSLRSMKYANVTKGEHFTLSAIRGTTVKLTRERGRPVYIDVSKKHQSHFDYGYAGTPHQLAHLKAKHFIADLSTNAFSTNQRQFFQIASQPENITIYTEKSNKLFEMLEQKSGNKLNAHEILDSSIDIRKNFEKFYQILENTIQIPGESRNKLSEKAVRAVDYSLRHLSERNAGFNHKDLLEVAITHAIGKVNRDQLLLAISAMEKAGVIFRGMGNNGVLWTTQEAIKLEKEIMALTQKDQANLTPIGTDDVVQRYVEKTNLNQEQIAAIKTIVQSKDRVLSIQGRAGTGKTTMMAALSDVLAAKELLKEQGYSLQGIAPTHKAVKELKERGIESRTIDRFLLGMRNTKAESGNQFSKTILIVDEASMVSNRKMRDVLSIAHQFEFIQVIPTGDTQQLPAVESGKPHQLIQNILDEKVIRLEDIRRQKNLVLKEAVKAIYQMDVTKTFAILGNSIIEIKDEKVESKNDKKNNKEIHARKNEENLGYEKRVKAIATDYVDLLLQNENVQIITPSHEDRKAVNAEVRQLLEEKGHLVGNSYSFDVLVTKDMTAVERSSAQNFKVGNILRFTTSSGKNIKAGDYFSIKEIDPNLNLLTLNKLSGKDEKILWKIPESSKRINQMVEVFKQEKRDVKIGDKIIWVRTDRKQGIHSSEFAKVTDIAQDKIIASREDGSVLAFNPKDQKSQHWDHGYAMTAYGVQGGTYSTVLALFESYRKNLMNLKTFLVTLTRPQNNLRIYTDDKAELQNKISTNKGEKLSSLEVINEYPSAKKISAPTKVTSHQPEKRHKPENKFQFDLERIKDGLNQNAEQLAIAILGQPKVRGSNFLKFGNKQGSLSVTTKGEKAGWWNDFSDSNAKGRSMLSFLEIQCNMTKQQAIEFAAGWLGIAPTIKENLIKNAPTHTKKNITNQSAIQETDYQKKMQAKAKKIAKESIKIAGTLAETYLKKHRGIDISDMKITDDIRFHPSIYSSINKQSLPALVSIVRDKSGEIISVEAVYLDPKSGNKAADLIVSKQTFGAKKGGSVTINRNEKSDTVILAEGSVTGLSVAKSVPEVSVKSVLGKQLLSSIDPRALPKNVVICVDYDGKDLKVDKTIRDAAERLQAHQKNVSFMIPSLTNIAKYDYNDILNLKGEAHIKTDFKHSISYRDFYKISPSEDHFIKTIAKEIKPQFEIGSRDSSLNKIISEDKLNYLSQKINRDSLIKEQKIHQAVEFVSTQKSLDKVAEIQSKSVQFEKEI